MLPEKLGKHTFLDGEDPNLGLVTALGAALEPECSLPYGTLLPDWWSQAGQPRVWAS